MKTILPIIVSFFIIVCSCRSSRVEKIQSTHNNNLESPISVGLLKINMFQDTVSHMIPIFSTDGEVVDTVVYRSDSVTVKNTVRSHIRFFYPEYGLVYFDVDSVDEANGRYYLDRMNYFVMRNSTTVFFSWNDFLQTVLIEPPDDHELFTGPEQKTSISFPGEGKMLVYSCDSVIGDWIHVETDTVCISSQTSFFSQGWTRWKIGDSLIVRIYLNC